MPIVRVQPEFSVYTCTSRLIRVWIIWIPMEISHVFICLPNANAKFESFFFELSERTCIAKGTWKEMQSPPHPKKKSKCGLMCLDKRDQQFFRLCKQWASSLNPMTRNCGKQTDQLINAITAAGVSLVGASHAELFVQLIIYKQICFRKKLFAFEERKLFVKKPQLTQEELVLCRCNHRVCSWKVFGRFSLDKVQSSNGITIMTHSGGGFHFYFDP